MILNNDDFLKCNITPSVQQKKNYNGGMDLCREKFFRFQENCVRFQATFFILPK